MNKRPESSGLQSGQFQGEYDIIKYNRLYYNNRPFHNTPSCSPSPQNEAEQFEDLNFSINSNTNFQADGFKSRKVKEKDQQIKIQTNIFKVLKVDKLVAIFKEKLMLNSHVLSQAKRELIKKIINEKYIQKKESITKQEFNIVKQFIFIFYILLKIKSSTI